MYLGIDLGTSEVKALVIDESGEIVTSHSAPLTLQRPHPRWSEQSPQAWWEATHYLMATLKEKCEQHWSAIKAIGLCGQMRGAVLLDTAGKLFVQRFYGTIPVVLWSARSLRKSLLSSIRLPGISPCQVLLPRNCCGFADKNPIISNASTQFYCQKTTCLLPKDYLRWQMTGKKISDMSDSTGTLWLDVARRDWSDALLEKCGLSRRNMPELVEGCDISATLAPEIAKRWGLNPSVVVAGGGGGITR